MTGINWTIAGHVQNYDIRPVGSAAAVRFEERDEAVEIVFERV